MVVSPSSGVNRAAGCFATTLTPVHPSGISLIADSMIELLGDAYRYRELVWLLALKELKLRYKRSVLGILWAVLHPLLMMVIFTLVFSVFLRFPIPNYSVFLVSALFPWLFFTQAMAYGAECLLGNAPLLKKVYVPKIVFPLATVLANFINFLLSLLPLMLVVVVLGSPVHWTWVYLPVPLLGLVLFTLGCCCVVATVNVFFHDVTHITQILLSAWFYLTPIIYSLEFVPADFRWLFQFNPLLPILDGFRGAIYYGQLPSGLSVGVTMGVGLLACWVGAVFLRRYQARLVLYI